MVIHDPLHHRQPKPQALFPAGRCSPVKYVKDMRQGLAIDSWAVVANDNLHGVFKANGGYVDGRFLGCVANGIVMLVSSLNANARSPMWVTLSGMVMLAILLAANARDPILVTGIA